MKNSLLLVVFFFAFALGASAQRPAWQLQGELGGNAAYFWGNPLVRQLTKPSTGPVGGLMLNYSANRRLSLQTGIRNEVKQYSSDPKINTVLITTYQHHYLTVPLHVVCQLGAVDQKWHYFILAGPYHSKLLKTNHQATFMQNDSMVTSDVSTDFKPRDIGVDLGLKLQYDVGPRAGLTLQMRNSLGLYNISALPIVRDKALRTNAFSLLFGFSYALTQTPVSSQ